MHNILIVIPARYASTRFPGKPLAIIGGKTMIERVYCKASGAHANVVVATDDERIANAVKKFDGRVTMTSPDHKSGTDRCLEAVRNYTVQHNFIPDIVVNIQGDEPFITAEMIAKLVECFDHADCDIATLVKPFGTNAGWHSVSDHNVVKVVTAKNGKALYFSRSVVPFIRGEQAENWPNTFPYMQHIGMYAYRTKALETVTALPQSSLEIAESLEQLRWLENGFTILTAQVEYNGFGIDTPEDLERANIMVQNKNL